ncbi:squalene-hopene cyclase [Bacillus sp. FJAT-27225]|uniref:squalene--hopene cyclase n=1 Tax=Bacillus sp. FJAT-27225 TaxID=1743144 RepID=UPI00080C2F49|nr:squalene--hopene cyclase [Bacillus sp. FJAT-27225]OCA85785.1 squalene-hopene cyclase [Bacillus sp. FJAT-27225]
MSFDCKSAINWIIETVKRDQSHDGSWRYPFKTGLSTDCYMIILLRTLEIDDEDLIGKLAARIASKQEANGAWKLFHDEKDGNLTTTVDAYYSLLYSGYIKKDDPRMTAARNFIVAKGGIGKANLFAKVVLALTGQYKWPEFFPMPVEVILLPHSFLINFYQFSVYGRANMTPILIAGDKQFSVKTKRSPDLSNLIVTSTRDEEDEWRSLFSSVEEWVKKLIGLPEALHELAIDRAKKYMLDRIEPDGTFYSYFSSTFFMVFALLALGYSKTDPIITKAIDGLKSMKTDIDGYPHMQYTTANVWNTSLISMALQEAGVPFEDPVVLAANRYLLERQHKRFGDWVVHNTDSLPGGWGFSDINTMNPDVDDTTASLRSIARSVQVNPTLLESWNRGVTWLLSMQNRDGGWAAFEKNIDSKWMSLLPIERAEILLGDPSTADLTGRTLEFLGNYTRFPKGDPRMKKAITWLLENQEEDGSWYGRWGICYIYGTWAAVTGLLAAGLPRTDPSIKRAVLWLKKIQNDDGGWGESCLSDSRRRYVALGDSTITDTAWALDTLITAEKRPSREIERGMNYLLSSLAKNDWTTDYPKGQMMPGAFYSHYHSYRYIFPLLALSNYNRKFGG